MFSGIVETTGTVTDRRGSLLTVRPASRLTGVAVGESVAVDGVCLTIESRRGQDLTFRILPETARVSTLGKLQAGRCVNLERALRAGDRLGGHLLLGHVDGIGRVEKRLREGASITLTIRAPAALTALLVPKGPVALDGVSLTLDGRPVERGLFRVHLVAHTLQATALGKKSGGQEVNVEADLIVKYLRGML